MLFAVNTVKHTRCEVLSQMASLLITFRNSGRNKTGSFIARIQLYYSFFISRQVLRFFKPVNTSPRILILRTQLKELEFSTTHLTLNKIIS